MGHPRIMEGYCPFCLETTRQYFIKREPASDTPYEIDQVNLVNLYVDLVFCPKCSSVFVFRNIPQKIVERYYKNDIKERNPANKELFHWHLHHTESSLISILKYIDKEARGPFLDIGCGIGALLYLAKERGWPVTGLEINPKLADFVTKELGIECINQTVINARLPNSNYAVITLCDVLEHLFEPLKTLQRCYELLKPGGILVLKVPNWRMQYFKEKIKFLIGIGSGNIACIGHINQFDSKSLQKVCQRAGLSPIWVYPAKSHLPVLGESFFKNPKDYIMFSILSTMNVLYDFIFRTMHLNLSFNLLGIARKQLIS